MYKVAQSEGQTTGSKCKLVKTATKSSAKSPRRNCKQEIRRLVKEAEESKQAGENSSIKPEKVGTKKIAGQR